jgi:beta-xylosidase
MNQPDDTGHARSIPWVSDCGDGTYRNPVLYADYADPDAIRVGEDYWLVASSFCHAPGLPILHSRDLVNWTLVNHALGALVPTDHFSVPRHGGGVWAPALRYHAGKFWIFYPDPDFGIYVITASDARGAWSQPYLLLAGKGLIDPCPFWDSDGSAYLVHAWARSRSGISNRLTLFRMEPDASRVLGEGRTIIEGADLSGWHTLEGPKFYRRGSTYYIFAPAGGVADGYQAVFRAADIWGPYEERVVLAQGRTQVNGPHQGAWVDTPAGEDWFLHFQQAGPYGRIVHLQPMRWGADGWPAMGAAAADGGPGEPVAGGPKPKDWSGAVTGPVTSDGFAQGRPGLQWQWQANPEPDWVLPSGGPGRIRLRSVARPASGTLWMAPNLLMQKFSAPTFTAETTLVSGPGVDGAVSTTRGSDFTGRAERSVSCCVRAMPPTRGASSRRSPRSALPTVLCASAWT